MKKLTKFLAIIAILLTTAALAACAGAETPAGQAAQTGQTAQQSGQVAAENGAVHLQVLWFNDFDEGDSFLRLTEMYREDNPHVTFELIEVPFHDLEDRLRNLIIGGMPPALARLTNLGPFQNWLVDLYEYLGEDFGDNFNDGLRFEFNGRMLAAPKDVTVNGIVYNRTAFEQAGVSVPQNESEIWTWEEWRAVMEQVVANSDVTYGLVFDRTSHRFSTLFYQAGASMLTPDLSASNFNTPEMHRAVTFFKELHDDGFLPASVWLGADNPNLLFRSGQVAMHFAGSWMLANYIAEIDDFEWGFTYLPMDVRRSSVPGGKYIAALQGTGVEAEAARFIEWISQPEINAIFMLENNFISQIRGNEMLDYEFGAEFFRIFASDLAASGSQPGAEWGFQEFTGLINVDLREGLSEVLAGILTVEEYLEMMDDLITRSLADINS
ncbi:MAG: sugar ABC transporter substrate-binding protein [Defluviitaleaceae bacterium]|nr:sugar ABC transporter substrate-binding protein [Defluviitaleaceae bacterium]